MAEKEAVESKERPTTTYSIKCSGFPEQLWKEWDADCKRKYGDCRWMKMWMDHLAAKEADKLALVIEKLTELEYRIKMLEQNAGSEPVKNDEVKTLGGEK